MTCLLSYLCSYIAPFIRYSLRYLLLFTSKQGCLQTCKYDQSLSVVETYKATKFHVANGFLFELWVLNLNKEKKKMKNSAHHSPIYDEEDLGHPYTKHGTKHGGPCRGLYPSYQYD